MIVIRATVADFDAFWSVFSTKGAAKRASHGSRGSQVFRVAGEPGAVIALFDWDRSGFEQFVQDPEVPQIMAAAGVQGPLQPTFVEEAGTLPS